MTFLRPAAVTAALATVVSVVMVLGTPTAADASMFGGRTPATITDPDGSAVELGVRFSAVKDIEVTGIRFYRGPQNSGRHVGRIWTPDGQVLSTVTFPRTSATGWLTAQLDEPVEVPAGTPLIASYVAPNGHYSDDVDGFARPVSDGVVTYPKSAGVYNYRVGSLPSQVWRDSNYFVDITYRLGGASSSPSPTATTTPTPAPSTSATASAPPSSPGGGSNPAATLGLPALPWWGGPSYYAKYSKAAASGWTSPSFFPIAVFYGKPSDAPALKAAGINTYMGAEHDGSPISVVTSTGISVLAQDEWSPSEIGGNARVVGWHVSDECEMGLGGCDGTTETARLANQQEMAAPLRSRNDGRFLQANFGNGVLGTYWAPNTMSQFVSAVDVTSVDKYAYTSPAVDGVIQQSTYWPKAKNPAASSAYGWLQDRMETFSASRTPNWVFVETGKPFLTEAGAKSIATDQIEGAVWNAIIHGAAGISYFQHNNSGSCGTYSILQCGSALTSKITAIDAQVQSLAPVINSASYQWSFGSGLDTSLKVSGGSAYVFAMTDGSTGSKTFTLPPGVGSTVEVVGENRTITASGGKFSDTFGAEYTHHIYKVALN